MMTRNFHRLKLTLIPSILCNPGFIKMYERSFRSLHKLLSFLSMISYVSYSILPLDFDSLLQKNKKYLLRHFTGDDKACSEFSESGNYILKTCRYLKISLVPGVSSLRPYFPTSAHHIQGIIADKRNCREQFCVQIVL